MLLLDATGKISMSNTHTKLIKLHVLHIMCI